MASNTNDHTPLITRDNYEEYLLLYVDNELSAGERSMVEAFLQAHPELRCELDLLMGTRLEPEFTLDPAFKESLMADQIRTSAVDELLLLHVDNELLQPQQAAVELRLQHDKAYQAEHELLLRTKSDPAEVVPYPNKDELYRHTVHLMRFAYAWRIAAALLLLGSMGLVWWMQRDGSDIGAEGGAAVAVQTKTPRKASGTQPVQNGAFNKERTSTAADQEPQTAATAPVQENMTANQLAQAPGETPASRKKTGAPQPAPGQQPVVLPATEPSQDLIAHNDLPVPDRTMDGQATGISAGKNNFDPGVTSQPIQTYTNTEAAAEPTFASSRENEGRNNLKVLLRKATRMVERRAHINATNDDDELLIGAVAIKLK